MKIALVSTGLGRILRGFESFTSSLFKNLRLQAPDLDVTLFQGGGKAGDRTVIVPNVHRGLTNRWLSTYQASILEHRSFALGLYLRLRNDRFDIVHYNELCMGSALFHLRRLFGGSFKLLYCNGAPSVPSHYDRRCDFAQMLTAPMFEEALAYGISPERLFFIPYGVDSNRFSPEVKTHRAEIRAQLDIPQNATVVLTVAELSRGRKRIDHVMRELSNIPEDLWFLAAGQRTEETQSLEADAEHLIPSRWKFVSWPHEQIHSLFGASDIFVLGSTAEGLPISSIEAMLSGIPLVLHNSPLFTWAAEGAPAWHVDMLKQGELGKAVREILKGYQPKRDLPLKRFAWDNLIPQYLRMYEQTMKGNPIAG
jgi:1,2-diacylglycerol 3-alpha-glucosyltransferase